jgi:hypothetical protein
LSRTTLNPGGVKYTKVVPMKHVVHIHQQKIRKNEPAIIDRTYKGPTHSRRLEIICPCCEAVAAVVVQSDTPDRCGARVWIEAQETAASEH